MGEVSKWACEYCTYENYPSALKCTMCRGAKPLLGEDIFRLVEEPLPAVGGGGGDSSPVRGASVRDVMSPIQDSWQCDTCTYINFFKSVAECSECHTPRCSAVGKVQEEEPGQLQVENCDELNPIKWTCPICTYDNWPRTIRCAMCGAVTKVSTSTVSEMAASNFEETNIVKRSSPTNTPKTVNKSPEITADDKSGKTKHITVHKRSNGRKAEETSTGSPKSPSNICEFERKIKRQPDWPWLNACLGVLQGDQKPVETYLSSGGDPTRQLTPGEVSMLNRPSAFDAGYTLVHLAIRFHRENMLASLLSRIEGGGSGVKRVPSYVAPDLASDIRRHVASTFRQRKASMPCPFVTEFPTFSLPADIEVLPTAVQGKLFEELLDKDVQQQLEADPPVINWSLEVTEHLGSRLYALWNRSAGDCLLDSIMQTTWGVFDRDNLLRKALSESLTQGGHMFYPRWREYESSQARLLHFSLEEAQWQGDWATLAAFAGQPGASLEQLHVFTLAHILRRPIIVYGVKYVKSFRGEDIGYARFEGVYLPLLWETSFCVRSPLSLGYTRGHFSALVPIEPYSSRESGANKLTNTETLQVNFLPLMDHNRKLLPVHFITESEMGQEEKLLRQWLDVCVTEGGLLVAQQKLAKRPLIVAQMLEEWLNHYRRLAEVLQAPYHRVKPVQSYSSDGDSDDESQFPDFAK